MRLIRTYIIIMVIIIIRIIIITSTLEKVTALWVWYKLGFTSRLILMDSRNDQEKRFRVWFYNWKP